jgi:hypothetical protein
MAWQEPSIPEDFGAVGDGVADDTDAMSDFFNFCIDNEREGYIPAGTYRVAHGALVFDNGFTDKPWPVIKTAGHGAVKLMGTGTTDAPIIEIKNGTANSPAGRYWQSGDLAASPFKANPIPPEPWKGMVCGLAASTRQSWDTCSAKGLPDRRSRFRILFTRSEIQSLMKYYSSIQIPMQFLIASSTGSKPREIPAAPWKTRWAPG